MYNKRKDEDAEEGELEEARTCCPKAEASCETKEYEKATEVITCVFPCDKLVRNARHDNEKLLSASGREIR